jgi:hypothetical protein
MSAAPSVAKLPNIRGGPLTEADYASLEARWIKRDMADAACRRVISIEGAEIVGSTGRPGNYSGLLITHFWPGESHVREHRLRRDYPDSEPRYDGTRKTVRKYLAPPGRAALSGIHARTGSMVSVLGDRQGMIQKSGKPKGINGNLPRGPRRGSKGTGVLRSRPESPPDL